MFPSEDESNDQRAENQCPKWIDHREVIPLQDSASLAGIVAGIAKPGDYVVCLGAGNITQWAYALPGELKALG